MAGKAWHAPGRYGALIGRTPFSGHILAQSIREEEHRADHIKIVNSGLNSLSRFAEETPPQFRNKYKRRSRRGMILASGPWSMQTAKRR
ncbi:MAG: hypothetical protein JRJ82_05370 [Deltaproteobacteria bacterium]|nr:hypothetical protein [Deltaproteobacteria bacterium]